MYRAVVHGLDGCRRVPGGLAVVVDLRGGDHSARAGDKTVVPQIAGKSGKNPVRVLEQLSQLSGARRILNSENAGIGHQPGSKSLSPLVSERAAAANSIPDSVVERAYAVSVQIDLI